MAVSSTGYTLIGKDKYNSTTKVWDPVDRDNAETGANLIQNVSGTNYYTDYYFYPVEEVEIMPGKEFIDFREIRGSRQAMITLDGPFRPTVNMRGALYPTGATALFFQGALGGISTANPSTNVYKHTFTDTATLPNFTIERADTQKSGATLVETISNCKVESLQVSCAFGEKADLTVNFQAAKKPVKHTDPFLLAQTTDLSAFPNSMMPYDLSGNLIDPLIFKDAQIKLAVNGGSETQLMTMKNINLELRNTLTRQETLTGSDETYKLFEGGLECTLSGAMVFEDTDMYNYVIAGTPVSIRLIFANSNLVAGTTYHGMEFYWPSVKVSRASLPFRAGEVIESDVEFKIRYSPALNQMVEISLTDSRSSY